MFARHPISKMENTSQFLYDNKSSKYYLAVQGKAVGPLTAHDIFIRIQSGESSPLHYIWKEGWADWKRICDDEAFKALIPSKPAAQSIQVLKQKIDQKLDPKLTKKSTPQKKQTSVVTGQNLKQYYLYANASQYGPFSFTEMNHVLENHSLGSKAYIWTQGWPTWKKISDVPEFSDNLPVAESTSTPSKKDKTKNSKTIGVWVSPEIGKEKSERRKSPRRPLVARLFLHNNEEVIIAVCRDISVGGMQVLTDRVPGNIGEIIKLNVSPGDSSKVKGFVAHGEIVRILEDGRGFSFRFKKLSTDAAKAIEKYIKNE